ncbi:MAG: helix-turn-helix transcriptional regulator [Bacteroidetes bacterium]|nr:helix-turn-helix transcriptional regulator [Bacteroidota bacterium]
MPTLFLKNYESFAWCACTMPYIVPKKKDKDRSPEIVKLDSYIKLLGQRITFFRKEKNLSLEKLGVQLGIDRSTMHRMENGQRIGIVMLIKLSLALDKKPKDFLDIPFDFHTQDLGGFIKSKKSSKIKKNVKELDMKIAAKVTNKKRK